MPARMQMTDKTPRVDGAVRARNARHGHVCRASECFARLSIGSGRYEVAHATDCPGLLAFRGEEQAEWTALDRRVSDGWIEIGADILLLDPDVMHSFLQTHAVCIAMRDGPTPEMDFDTMGIAWSARLLDNREGEVRLADGTWHHGAQGLRPATDARERAILVLLKAVPDLRAHFEPHVSLWARRIAQGLRVMPNV